MNIILIGYRGSGKSTIASLLGGTLGRPVIAMDAEIERRAGRTIPEMVAAHGWPHFRELEAELAGELAGRDQIVIDTGGGIVTQAEPMAALRASGRVFWLAADPETLIRRIAASTNRPSLTGQDFRDEVAQVLAERLPLYRAAAHHEIDTKDRPPEACRDEIVRYLDRGPAPPPRASS